MTSYVIKCNHCGGWRVATTNNIVKYKAECFFCKKMFSIYCRGNPMVSILGPMDNYEATIRCQKLNGGRNK